MDPITVSTTIARPREEVFEYLADIANHAEFTDHYLVNWHLTRENSYGKGAGARFRVKAPLNRFSWADVTIADLQPPFRIVEQGRGGKFNRIRMLGTYTLSCHSCRHLCGGLLDTFSTAPVRHRLWKWLSKINHYHMPIAWVSLVGVALTDLYVRLVASGTIHDPRFF